MISSGSAVSRWSTWGTLDEGTHTIALRCKELNPDDRDIVFHQIRLAAVELGMD